MCMLSVSRHLKSKDCSPRIPTYNHYSNITVGMGCEEIREAPFIADRGYSNIVCRFVSMRFIAKCSRAFVCADHGTKNFFVPLFNGFCKPQQNIYIFFVASSAKRRLPIPSGMDTRNCICQ